MNGCGRVAIIVAMATFIGRFAAAERLDKVWEVDLGEGAANLTGGSDVPLGVFALSFSPDGQRIAVVVGRSVIEQYILILGVGAPQTDRKRIEVNPKIWGRDLGLNDRLWWSSSGQHFALGRTVVGLNGNTCSLPESAGSFFVGPAQVAAPVSTRLSFFDSDCHATGTLELGKNWRILDVSADRRLLCIWQYNYTGVHSSKTVSVIDAVTGKALRQFTLPHIVDLGPFTIDRKSVV